MDEADEMLNMGFVDDIELILGFAKVRRCNLTVSKHVFKAPMLSALETITS